MKSTKVVLSVLVLTVFAACSHLSLLAPKFKNVAHAPTISPELNVFLEAAANSAKEIAFAESLSDWQSEYDKIVEMRGKLPEESLTKIHQKECDSIVKQMEMGKLAVEMKRVDAKIGLKQCKLVSADILKHVKNIKSGETKAKA